MREQIAGLVRWHGLPPRIADKSDPERAVILASMSCRLDLLAIVATADARGRAKTPQEYLDGIALCTSVAEELGCGSSPCHFFSDHSRFMYFRDPRNRHTCQVYDDTRAKVTLMSGLPGSGKNTWIAGHAAGMEVISLDDIRVEMGIRPDQNGGRVIQAAKERARQLLREGRDFVWNATNTTRQLRQALIALFADYGACCRIVYVEAPYAELQHRNRGRKAPVPVQVLSRLINQLEVPDCSEAHQVHWAIADIPDR